LKKLPAVGVFLDSALLKQKRLASYFNYDFPYEEELKRKEMMLMNLEKDIKSNFIYLY